MRICGVSIYTCITTPLLGVVKTALQNEKALENDLNRSKKIYGSLIKYVYEKLKRN